MKEYIRPTMHGEIFAANEYVTACYKLACHRGSHPGKYNSLSDLKHWDWAGESGSVSHSVIGTAGTCGDASANRVITSEGGSYPSVGEYNKDQGWLKGELTDWIDQDHDDVISPGDTIFWYTKTLTGGYRRWNHWGVVQQEDPNHPNHS